MTEETRRRSERELANEYVRHVFGLDCDTQMLSHIAHLLTDGPNRLQAQVRLLAETLPEQTLFEVLPSDHAAIMAADDRQETSS
ncbi:MAG: hypothetical protein ACTS10_10690 [Kiloniellales bacterium]